MAEFDDATFLAKDWINAACRNRPKDTPLETYIMQLEMQLQLRCEDVEADIETTAGQLAHQMPSVLQAAEHIQGEMTSLHETLTTTVAAVDQRSAHARDVVSGIQELHRIKSNMQTACNSLKEATELSELFVRVDAVFNSGDIFAMAKIMSTMHRSLKLVGNVPEFQSGKEKLKALEESLISSVEAKLSTAIHEKQNEQIQKLNEILVSLEASAVAERTFVAVKRQEMKSVLRSTTERLVTPSESDLHRTLMEGVREWQEALIHKVNDELEWCCTLFPERGPSFLVSSVKALLEDWNPSVAQVLEKQQSVEWIRDVQEATVEFCLTLKHLLEAIAGDEAMESVVTCALEPTEKAIAGSAQLEKQMLMDAVDQFSASFTSPSQMDHSIQTLYELTEGTISSCLALSGGTEMPELASEIEQCWMAFLAQRISSLKTMRSAALPETSEEPENLASILHLLKVARTLEQHLCDIDAKFEKAAQEIQNNLGRSSIPLDLVHLRLKRLPEKEKELQAFLTKGNWKGRSILQQSVDGFSAASEALVFDALMHKPRFLFKGFGQMEEWKRVDSSAGSSSLPQFSAYPLHYVSALGEYLMMVPQLLEALVSTQAEADEQILDQEQEMASSLLSKVIVGSAELYGDEILGLSNLTNPGVVQMTCDLQYFSNVLSAMGTTFPPSLASVNEAVQAKVDQIQQQLEDATMDSNRRTVFETMLKMRNPSS